MWYKKEKILLFSVLCTKQTSNTPTEGAQRRRWHQSLLEPRCVSSATFCSLCCLDLGSLADHLPGALCTVLLLERTRFLTDGKLLYLYLLLHLPNASLGSTIDVVSGTTRAVLGAQVGLCQYFTCSQWFQN